MNNLSIKSALVLVATLAIFTSSVWTASACTRAVYLGPSDTVITGRTMDWMEDIKTNLWVFPRGMKRNGNAGANSIHWVSKYGSLIASGYDVGTADGMNEVGLVANILYLAESNYGTADQKRPTLSIAAWGQYVLDNFATVGEAVDTLSKEPFRVISPVMPNGSPATLHLAVSDPTGDSAIFEYVAGKLVIHKSRQYQIMTNSPVFDQQLALNAYWQNIGGLAMLPGTNRAADRFVRASFYIKAIPQTAETRAAVAGVFSVMRNVSVPLGIATPSQPNISSTIWRTVSDQKNKVYYYESTLSPNIFWVSLKDLDFTPGASVKMLPLTSGQIYAQDVAHQFQAAKPFVFLSATPQQ